MSIFTSYYAGQIKGEAVSISLNPPPNWKGKHLPLFAPTSELLRWWKSSAKDIAAQSEYKRVFRKILDSRQQLIQLWVNKQQSNPQDMTLCCFEKSSDFCHRHLVGEEVLQKHLPQLWGGEVEMSSTPQLNFIQGETINHSAIYSPLVLSLIEKCHSLGYPVQCDRLPCGYYRVSLHGEDLGEWSELGVLSVLSSLQHEFYRQRLVPSLVNTTAIAKVKENQEFVTAKSESPNLITRLRKLEGQELAQIQDWCKWIKNQMFPSVSKYADGRLELHLRRFVSLTSAKSGNKAEVKLIEPGLYPGSFVIEELGEKLLPNFHQALVLFYPAGTQIKVHRDSPAYVSGAAQINVMGRARFFISGCQNVRLLESYWLEQGDCISFDNKQPHGIERVQSARWCICFFKLKPEYLETSTVKQMSLVS